MAEITVTATKENLLFRISIQKLNGLYTVFEDELLGQIREMRLLGLSDEAIYQRILENVNKGLDYFGRFKGALEREIDGIVGKTAQLESNMVLAEVEEKLKWELDPTVREHCPDCLRNSASETKTFEEWEMIGLPGMGNTQCGDYCKCSLVTTRGMAE